MRGRGRVRADSNILQTFSPTGSPGVVVSSRSWLDAPCESAAATKGRCWSLSNGATPNIRPRGLISARRGREGVRRRRTGRGKGRRRRRRRWKGRGRGVRERRVWKGRGRGRGRGIGRESDEEAQENPEEYFSQQEMDKQREQEPAKESDDDLEPFYEELDRECDLRNRVAR